MKRVIVAILGLLSMPGITVCSRAQSPSTYVQWGAAGTSPSHGMLDATLIPTDTGSNGVRYSNVNGMGYDVVVLTEELTHDGAIILPWNNETGWYFEGMPAEKAGKDIPYSTVWVFFYQQGTNVPFGVTGVDFTFQNAKVGERFRNFNYWDTVGYENPLTFTDNWFFSYSSGAPNIHLSDGSIDSGSPYEQGTIEGDWIGVDLSPLAISGFSYQTGRVDSGYGDCIMTALGYLVPTGQLLVETGSNLNISAGPRFVSTGSNAVLTPGSLTGALSGSNVAVVTGSSISQNIEIEQNIASGAGNSLTMNASQYLLSLDSSVSLTSTTGNAGGISLTAVLQSAYTNHLEACASTGTGGSISVNAGNNIVVINGIDTSASMTGGQGGDIALRSGNTVTVDSIRSGGGGGTVRLGAPGNITLCATNSISVGGLYDDSGPGGSPLASFTAPSITLDYSVGVVADISGTLTLQMPLSADGATIAISGTVTGPGSLVINSGDGTASLYSNATLTGETDILSGTLLTQGHSLASSDLVLDNQSILYPGVATPGGYVAVKSLTVGTNATANFVLTSATTYDQVQSARAANLDGIFSLTLPIGFTPAIGQVFQVMTFSSANGEFGTYVGVRLSNCVLQPEFTGTSMLLVTSTIPTGASQPLQTVPAGGLNVSAGGYYDGLTVALPIADGFTAAATLIDGIASQATKVSMSLAAAGTADFQLQGSLGETLLNLLGTGNDKVVVQLDYNETAALAAAGDERELFLASSDGSTPFANAVLANTDLPGEANNPTEFIRAYNPATDFHLGYYGVDTVNNRVWAVVDYDGFFGLGAQDVSEIPFGPASATEPASEILALSATLNGLVNFNGSDTIVLFESGTSPTLAGATMTPVDVSDDDDDFVQVNCPVTGLTPFTTYYFRVDAFTTDGTEFGDILSFSTPLSGINNWRYEYFGTYTNSGNAADTANPAGDGIVNLLKYATGTSPWIASSSEPATIGETGSGSGAYLTLTFNEIADPNLTYTVQATNDLSGTWSTIWSSTGAGNVEGSVTVQDAVPIDEQPSRFLRLQVSD